MPVETNKNPVRKQTYATTAARRLAWKTLLFAGMALAQPGFSNDGSHEAALPENSSANKSSSSLNADGSNPLPRIGMSMETVRQLLTDKNTNEELIGGACGMLEVISSDDNSLRVIGVGGVVTSVSTAAPAAEPDETEQNLSPTE